MNEMPKISDAEWEVMEVLWEKNPLTASEIIEELKHYTSWNPKTIHTLISRLVNKNAVEVNKCEPYYLYSPVIREDECRRMETNSFLKKVYNGSFKVMLSHFLEQENLSAKELEELKRILDNSKE